MTVARVYLSRWTSALAVGVEQVGAEHDVHADEEVQYATCSVL
jgi:hypothetical protein